MAWFGRLWNVLRPSRLQRDLNRELSFHVLERTEELEAGGMNPEEAARMAQLQLGNYPLQVERTRDMDIQQGLEATLRNLRHAVRALAKAPGFTATVVATLALGIGANSAVFSAIYAVLLRPLPFPNADRLVTLSQLNPKMREPFVAPARLADWNRLNTTFQAITGYYSEDESELSGELPERLTRALVARRFLEVWGVAPQLGRDFTPLEEHFGGPPAVIISDRFWRRRFNADPNVIGKTLRFGTSRSGPQLVPIVGVMPASFQFPLREVDLWSPSPDDAFFAHGRELTWYSGVGRLKTGVTLAQARSNLAAVQAELGREFPKTDAQLSVEIEPLKDATIGAVRGSLWILFGSVSLLLLIACTNVAALLLSRAAARQQEISVRFSLGASRSSVVGHLLAEVFILAVSGAAVGLLLAGAAAAVFRSLAKDLPRIQEIALDWRIVFYSLACALIATLVCGLLPAIRGTRNALADSARGTRTTVSGGNRTQFVLTGVQVALAVTLLSGAGLLIRSLQQLGRVSPGFETEHILTFQVSNAWGETADMKAVVRRVHRILDTLQALPGVEAAATTYDLPGVPSDYQVELKADQGRAETEPKVIAEGRTVSPSYFAALGIPLLAGETCREEAGIYTMMVNRAFANAYFAGSSPVGHHLSQPDNLYIPSSVVRGVVGDARETGLDREPVPTVYWCFSPGQPGTRYLARTHGDPRSMSETIRRAVHQIEPLRSVYDVAPLADQISDAYSENRLRTILLAFFASAAILLACVGLYGTISYAVNLRKREVGLRLALGAMRSQVVRHFLTQGLLVSALGCLAGIAMALAFTRVLAGMLYGVSANDPATLAGVAIVVLSVSFLASLLPAVRAARLEPIEVLRDE
ncbi:MAG TPA: ABC transporter permease [Bryobacteraceae bacterium]|nr:ABC transporter permease [Bryobacteraceae bacterium]